MTTTDEREPGEGQLGEHMRDWRQAHPRATLTELETELDRHLRRIRAAVLTETVASSSDEVGTCSACGHALVRRGTRERRLITAGDEPLILQRPYATCPACGNGLFPPG